MATLTVRNVPEDAKHRFRQVAAAHGRSMEEHLRQMVIEAEPVIELPSQGVGEVTSAFRHEPVASVLQSDVARDAAYAARIRAMSSREFIEHLVATAAGADLELPTRTTGGRCEVFGAD